LNVLTEEIPVRNIASQTTPSLAPEAADPTVNLRSTTPGYPGYFPVLKQEPDSESSSQYSHDTAVSASETWVPEHLRNAFSNRLRDSNLVKITLLQTQSSLCSSLRLCWSSPTQKSMIINLSMTSLEMFAQRHRQLLRLIQKLDKFQSCLPCPSMVLKQPSAKRENSTALLLNRRFLPVKPRLEAITTLSKTND
jgi:hypothetical protein